MAWKGFESTSPESWADALSTTPRWLCSIPTSCDHKTPDDNEYFAVSIAIAKQCLYGENPLDADRFPASGTDFSLKDDLKTADRRLSKWFPTVLLTSFHKTGSGKWPPYGGSSLHDQVFPPLECIDWFSMHFNWFFCVCVLLDNDFA